MEFVRKYKITFILLLTLFQTGIVHSQSSEISVPAEQGEITAPLGKWEGKLQVPGFELRVFFEIKATPQGKLSARMASPDQGANNIPVERVDWKQDSLFLDVKVIGGTYIAKLSTDETKFVGQWTQGGTSLPLVMNRVSSLQFYPKRPQEPQEPFPYKEEHVQYPNKEANITLGGTLTVPEGKGPFPTVLLISGSGSQNRDSEIMGHKPFWIIADYLTRRGLAVLRVDDRGGR